MSWEVIGFMLSQTLCLTHPQSHNPTHPCRNAFGNNPDTSKALRFLVAENRIVRSGAGGRKDPYSYVVRETGAS